MRSTITRVDLLILREPGLDLLVLSDRRGRWLLPAAICAGAQTGQLALTLLNRMLGGVPGQRLWLLGVWPPVAAYVALVPRETHSPQGACWWPVREAIALLDQPESAFVHRAAQWLRDGGAVRRGIA